MVHTCPRRVQEKAVAVVPSSENVAVGLTEKNGAEDGFTLVKRTGRRTESQVNKVSFSAGGSGAQSEKTRRDPATVKDPVIIAVSNKFGSLGVDVETQHLRKETINSGEDKENENTTNHVNQSRSVAQGNGGFPGRNLERSKGGARVGLKERKAATAKPMEVNGPKFKQARINKPMRGLVFGPAKGEALFSSSGKRLRVEGDSLGLTGGALGLNGGESVEGGDHRMTDSGESGDSQNALAIVPTCMDLGSVGDPTAVGVGNQPA